MVLLVLQCDFGLPTKVVVPSWHINLTIPLVSEEYKLDGLLGDDSTNTILVYGDSVDTNSDGTMDILLPDTLADYPGGLYITLENDLPPITLPEDMFVIPGQDPMELGVGPIDISSSVPAAVDTGISVGPEADTLSLDQMGFSFDDQIITVPDADCADLTRTRDDTIKFTFGSNPSDLNQSQDVSIPGYIHTVDGSYPSNVDDGCIDCGGGQFVCDSSYSDTVEFWIAVNETSLPTVREAYALLPDPSVLPDNTPIESFESLTISTGSISSTINSQIPLSARNTGLKVYTKKADGSIIDLHTHFFTTIEPYMGGGEQVNKTSSLNGVSVFDSLIFEFTGTIDDANIGFVGDTLHFPQGVAPAFQYSFEMNIDGFTSLQANMKDTTFTVYQEMNTSNSDPSGQSFSVDIVSASFKDNVDHADTNNLNISMENLMGLDIDTIKIKLHNFYENQADLDAGVYEIIAFTLPDSATADTTVVLDGHLISNTTGDNTPIDSLLFETEIKFSSGGGPVSIAYPFPEAMGMDVEVEMTTLRIADLTGLFDIGFEISDQEQPLSLPGLVGGITFGEAILAITLENEFGVEPGLGLFVNGYRDDDSVVVALNPDSVTFDAGAAGDPTITEIRISRDYVRKTVDSVTTTVQHFENQDNIVDLMAMMPSLVSVGGDAQIAPDGLSSITAGAEVQGKWRFEIPFLLSVASGGVEFMNASFTEFDSLDEGTIEQLVGENGVPDESDMLISSSINTEIYNDIGIGFGLEILVSDLPYFPFYSSLENKMLVSADLDLDGTADTVDLDLDTLIMHPVVKTLKLEIPAGTPDMSSGLVLPGNEGYGNYSYSADFNLNDEVGDSTYGTLKHKQYALLDTIMLSRSDTAFIDVQDALTRADLNAPTVADSLYNLTLSPNSKELWLMMDVSRYGELGWLIEPKTHYIGTKFILDETPNPALFSFTAGIDVTAYMEFILNSEPIFAGAEEDSTE